jgi:iron(III) transport system substrate-binding protein
MVTSLQKKLAQKDRPCIFQWASRSICSNSDAYLLTSGMQHSLVSFALVLFAGAIGCVPRKEKSVVLYSAADREFATPILDAFDRNNTGTEVSRQFDVEASKTLGLVTRIEREKDRPRCDVFWNNEIIHTIRLQKQGLLAKHRWQVPDSWPKNYRAKDGTWIGFAARARVLLVNKEKLPDATKWPKSVLELADAKWHHRAGVAYPLYGTTATHMAIIASHAESIACSEPAYSASSAGKSVIDVSKWTSAMAEHAVVLGGNKQVALAVSSGELDWGLTDTDDAVIEIESGRPVALVFPDQEAGGFGTLFIPNTVSILAKSPNPIAASALADYLVSEKVEGRLAMGNSAQFPIWPEAKQRSRLEGDAKVRWAEIDFEKAAEVWPTVSSSLKEKFDSK